MKEREKKGRGSQTREKDREVDRQTVGGRQEEKPGPNWL